MKPTTAALVVVIIIVLMLAVAALDWLVTDIKLTPVAAAQAENPDDLDLECKRTNVKSGIFIIRLARCIDRELGNVCYMSIDGISCLPLGGR